MSQYRISIKIVIQDQYRKGDHEGKILNQPPSQVLHTGKGRVWLGLHRENKMNLGPQENENGTIYYKKLLYEGFERRILRHIGKK